MEASVASGTITWVIRIIVVSLVIFFIKGRKWLRRLRERHPWLVPAFRVYLIGGGIGWVIGLGSLLF
jgi:hypothetical protein